MEGAKPPAVADTCLPVSFDYNFSESLEPFLAQDMGRNKEAYCNRINIRLNACVKKLFTDIKDEAARDNKRPFPKFKLKLRARDRDDRRYHGIYPEVSYNKIVTIF